MGAEGLKVVLCGVGLDVFHDLRKPVKDLVEADGEWGSVAIVETKSPVRITGSVVVLPCAWRDRVVK